MTITRDDLDLLLKSELPDPVLLLMEGCSRVVDGSVLRRPAYAQARLIGTRDDLASRLGGGEPGERELDEVVTQLDTQVNRWGVGLG